MLEEDSRPANSESTDDGADCGAQDDSSIHELRDLLFHEERSQLAGLQSRLNEFRLDAEDVAEVLPEAIQETHPAGLAQALTPTIEEGLRESVRRDPAPIADALFPVIGPAIRKSIADTISRLIQSFNQDSRAQSVSTFPEVEIRSAQDRQTVCRSCAPSYAGVPH